MFWGQATDPEPIEGKTYIRNYFSKITGFCKSQIDKIRKSQSKLYFYQRRLADFIKRHRTVKILHLTRSYSALAVVVSSSLLVAVTNISAREETREFLFDYLGNNQPAPTKNIESQAGEKKNLTYAPLMKTKTVVDLEQKEEEELAPAQMQSQSFIASAGVSERDPEEGGGVKIYTVKEGDTMSAIAVKNGITVNTILWANDIENIDEIMPGDKIFILPVAGVKHIVAKGDTIDSITKKYKADKDKIIAFNELPADGAIEEGEELIIPGGEKEIPSTASPANPYRRQYATPQGGTPTVSGWKKLEGKAGAGHRFPYGYCTWYVAQRRFVPWGGNAGAWLYNAKSMGYYTGKTPKVGSIIVTAESWWGHVGVVESVGGGSVTISEMNYNRWGKVNRRSLPASSRVIKGYIY